MKSHHLFFTVNVLVFVSWQVLAIVKQASFTSILTHCSPEPPKNSEGQEEGNTLPQAQERRAKRIPSHVFPSRSLTLCRMTVCWSALTQLTFLAPASCSGCSEKAKPCKTDCAVLPFSATSQQRQPLRTQLWSAQVERKPWSYFLGEHYATLGLHEIMYNQQNVPSMYNWE